MPILRIVLRNVTFTVILFTENQEKELKINSVSYHIKKSLNLIKAFFIDIECNYIAFTIATKSSAFKAAPPINPPSTSGFPKISCALSGFTLPP